MKKYSVLLTTALVATTLLTGCSNDEASMSQEGKVAISLTCSAVSAEGTISDMTRAGSSDHPTIASGEAISVYMPESSVTTKQTYTASTAVATNTAMTTTGTKPYFVAGQNTVKIYGFYPSTTTMNTTVSHTVNTDQSGETNYKASDLMFAKTSVTKAAQATVTGNLNFAHLMSKIIVNVTSTTGCTPTSIKILNVKKTVTFDPSSYTFSNSSISGLTTTNNVSTTGITIGTATGCAGLIPAQTVAASTNLIEVTTSAGKATFALGNTAKTFYPGMTYTVTLTVNTATIGITSTIINWVDSGDPMAGNLDTPVPPDPRAVDLGLSVKWATMNVGATSVTDYGTYFAWGETGGLTVSGHDVNTVLSCAESKGNSYFFFWSTYKWNPSGDGSTMTKYNSTDGKTQLDLDDDAAYAWGGNWRMPTYDEIKELKDTKSNTTDYTWTWYELENTVYNGVAGYEIKRITGTCMGNSIFLPAAGSRGPWSFSGQGSVGDYWSSSLDTGSPSSARYLGFISDEVIVGSDNRFVGLTVRPVQ